MGWNLRFCISNKCPFDADLPGHRSHFWDLIVYIINLDFLVYHTQKVVKVKVARDTMTAIHMEENRRKTDADFLIIGANVSALNRP